MKYARLASDGTVQEIITWDPTGNYHPDIAKLFEQVPDEIEVGWILDRATGKWSAPEPVPDPEPLPQPDPVTPEEKLAAAKKAKLAEVNTACDLALNVVTAEYPAQELLTFDKQETEARALIADPTVSTPLLSALASARGIPLEELAQRIIAKADIFATVTGTLIGQRQGYEDRIDTATSLEEVEAILPKYTFPGSTEPDQEAA